MDPKTIIRLGSLALDFSRVERATRHQDGKRPETDSDHTVMLGLVALAIAEQLYPELDRGRIAQYALVHDLPEVYAGDTPTLRPQSPAEVMAKNNREYLAAGALILEMRQRRLPALVQVLYGYEELNDREARFVKAVDKLVPKITHLLNGGVTVREQGLDLSQLAARYLEQGGEMVSTYAGDFPELLELRQELVSRLLDMLHAREQGSDIQHGER